MKLVLTGVAGAAMLSSAATAETGDRPVDGALGMLNPASPLASEVQFFHDIILLPLITVISLFVLALLVWVMVRYNAKANPNPRKFSHNTVAEILWTGIPIVILLAISIPSFELLYKEDVIPDGKQTVLEADGANKDFVFKTDFAKSRLPRAAEHVQVFRGSPDGVAALQHGKDYKLAGLGTPEIKVSMTEAPAAGDRIVIRAGRSLVGRGDQRRIELAPSMTIKVTGLQWAWAYSYPDFGDFEFVANMLPEDQTTPDLYRFATDRHMVVPVGETIRIVTTARDVIHAWALPNFAVKIDAVPGRLNETWINAEREGVFYGQCSEICGIRHSAMPITVEVVSREKFEAWVDEQRVAGGMEPFFAKPQLAAASLAPPMPAASPVSAGAAEVKRCQDEIDSLFAGKTIEFATGGASINEASRPLLDSLTAAAKGCSGVAIDIAGHTDSTGSETKNVELSKARADAVRAYLAAAGVDQGRLAAAGFGSSRPIADNGSPSGRAQNRRIEFAVKALDAAQPAN